MSFRAIVLQGFGLHCYEETFKALQHFHHDSEIYDLRYPREEIMPEVKFIIVPGGFSFGDELGAGLMMARYIKIVHPKLYAALVDPCVMVLGICNGFQVLTHMEIFEDIQLKNNFQEHFVYKWTDVTIRRETIWFQSMPLQFQVCVRHGEGKIVTKAPENLVLEYVDFTNGNTAAAAVGIHPTKLGIMPHPEISLSKPTPSLKLIANGVDYARVLL